MIDYSTSTVKTLLKSQTITATATGTAVDTQRLDGVGKIVLLASAASAGTLPTLNVKLTECATSGGSYTDVTGAVFTEVTDAAASTQQLAIPCAGLLRYVKAVATVGGTATPTFSLAILLDGLQEA